MASAVSNLANRSSNNTRFNAEAAAWDSRPFVHEASREASKAILARLSLLNHADASTLDTLELGCGTGILSFLLAPHLRSITAVDAAEGMIEVLRGKLDKPDAPKNILPLALLLEDPEDSALPSATDSSGKLKYGLITSHLVLHHIPDLESVLNTMHGCLAPGGCVMLTDFQDFGPQAKRFHPANKMEGVARHGINAKDMAALMKQIGFKGVDVRPHWTMTKTVEKFDGEFDAAYGGTAKELAGGGDSGEPMDFPFLICYGRK